MSSELRLQKFIAGSGLCSRRKAEEMILQNRVRVNGRPVKLGDKVDPKRDIVTVDGERVGSAEQKIYVMINKPRGYVTTMQDERGRKCVAQLVSDIPERLFPVGRLDRESEGLLFMTNDGEFANMLSHPSGHVPKLYRVTVHPEANEDMLVTMSTGMVIDGIKTAPCKVRVLAEEKGRSVLEIILNEGRNRQIRKMCEQLGLEVVRLKRNAVGPVKLGMLQPGEYRELTEAEIKALTNYSMKMRKQSEKREAYDKNKTSGR